MAPDDPALPIQGLDDGRTYRVIVIDDNTIQLTHGSTIELSTNANDPNAIHTLSRRNIIDFEPSTAVNEQDDEITFSIEHPFTQGQQVDYWVGSDGADAIGGLENEEVYYVDVVDSYTIRLLTPDGTEDGVHPTETPVDIGGTDYYVLDLEQPAATTTTVEFDPTVDENDDNSIDADLDTIELLDDHNLTAGQAVEYRTNGGTSISSQMVDQGIYYVINLDRNQFQLALSTDDASDGIAIDFDEVDDNTPSATHELVAEHLHLFGYEEPSLDFSPVNDIDTDTGEITFATNHNWQTGDAVVYAPDTTIQKEVDVQRLSFFSAETDSFTFDPTTTTSDDEPVVDTDEQTINLDVSHNMVTGQRLTYYGDAGTTIGLQDSTDYFAIVNRDFTDRLQVAATRADALNGIAITTLTDAAAGNHRFETNEVDVTDSVLAIEAHDLQTGQVVNYTAAGGTAIGNLTSGNDYYVIRINDNLIRLAANPASATAGTAMSFSSAGTGDVHSLQTNNFGHAFDPTRTVPVVDTTTSQIEIPDHGLAAGDTVLYLTQGGDPIGG